MVRDRRLWRIHRRSTVHERRRPERRLARLAAIDEDRRAFAQPMRVGGRQFHEQVVRVLAVDQRLDAIGGLAGGKQKGIAIRPHERVGREHGAEVQDIAVGEVASGRAHRHAGQKRLLVAARAVLQSYTPLSSTCPISIHSPRWAARRRGWRRPAARKFPKRPAPWDRRRTDPSSTPSSQRERRRRSARRARRDRVRAASAAPGPGCGRVGPLAAGARQARGAPQAHGRRDRAVAAPGRERRATQGRRAPPTTGS